MTLFEQKRLAVEKRQAKALERIADALEKQGEPLMAELSETGPAMTWQAAARVLRDTCAGAERCDEECPMFEWCEKALPGDAHAPVKWPVPE